MQDIFNNPFGDFNNQFISDVAIGKSTEITDLVTQQQPENAFCNLTDTMNNINNNKFNHGHDENNFMVDDISAYQGYPVEQEAQNVLVLSNDDNNNSNDNFGGPDMGPETDVDAIDEEFHANATAAKEKTQMEFKETEDVADRADILNFGADHSAIYGSLENKIFEEMSLQNPDMMKNPFALVEESAAPVAEFLNSKFSEINQQAEDFADKFDLKNEAFNDDEMAPVSKAFEPQLTYANEDIAIEEHHKQQSEATGESLSGKLDIFLICQSRLENRDSILYSSTQRPRKHKLFVFCL